MQPKTIKTPLPVWARKIFTEKVLPASENTSKENNQSKGKRAEALVASHYLSLGYRLYTQNQKVSGVEVDLIFKSSYYTFVEVKSLRSWEEMHFRVSKFQQNRLLFAREVWEAFTGWPVSLEFAFVCQNKIQIINAGDLVKY